MKTIFKIISVIMVIALTASLCACSGSKGNEESDVSGASSAAEVSKSYKSVSTDKSFAGSGVMTFTEYTYITQLLTCLGDAEYSSIFTLSDQICLGFLNSMISYTVQNKDSVLLKLTQGDDGTYTYSKNGAAVIIKQIFNYTLVHNSDYLIGSDYIFSGEKMEFSKITVTDVKTIDTLIQIYYTTEKNGKKISHIATVIRSDGEYSPFMLHSVSTLGK